MKTKRIAITITEQQEEILNMLVGQIGTNQSDVANKILVMWMNDQKYFSEYMRKKVREDTKK